MERDFWEMWFPAPPLYGIGDFMRVVDTELKINKIAHLLRSGNDGFFFFYQHKGQQ